MIANEQIAERAYGLWEKEGRPHGRALDHWLTAMAEIEQESRANGGDTVSAMPSSASPARGRKARATSR